MSKIIIPTKKNIKMWRSNSPEKLKEKLNKNCIFDSLKIVSVIRQLEYVINHTKYGKIYAP